MGLWGDSGVSIGGVFDGSMSSSGSGARIKLGVNMPGPIPDIPLVDTHVPGFAKGGVIPGRGPSRGQAMEAQAVRRGQTRRPADARAHTPTSPSATAHRHDTPRHTGGRWTGVGTTMAALTPASVGLSRGGPVGVQGTGPRRLRHEMAPGIPCPSCAAGITKPVR